MDKELMNWRHVLDIIEADTQPSKLAEDLAESIVSTHGDEESGVWQHAAYQAEYLVQTAGIAAAYVLPPEDPTVAVETFAERLNTLDFEKGIESLSDQDARRVRLYIEIARPLFQDWSRVLNAVLGVYVRGDYDLNADPNAVILEGESALPMNPQKALDALGRAGAMGLRGKPFWWRWEQETQDPLRRWIVLANDLIAKLTGEGDTPLGTVEQERIGWHKQTQAIQEAITKFEAMSEDAQAELEDELEEDETDEEDQDRELEGLLAPLFETTDALPSGIEQSMQARRDELIPSLIDMVQDEELWGEYSEGAGWAPIHAVDLLGKLRAVEAVPTLIDVMGETEWDEIIHDHAVSALTEIGSPAGRAVLETLRYTRNHQLKTSLTGILGKVGRDEPETFERLAILYDELPWDDHRLFVIWSLADLGDRRAIPLIQKAWDDPALPEIEEPEIREALKHFGVEPPPHSKGARARFNPIPMRSHTIRLGRNDPCWCGSGKKYKHCHLASDEQARRAGNVE